MTCLSAIHHTPLCKSLAGFMHSLLFQRKWRAVSTASSPRWEQIYFVTHEQEKVKDGQARFSCQKLLRHMLVSHDRELMAMSWYWGHTSSSCSHVMFLTKRVIKKHMASLAQAPSPHSLLPVWLTLHQIARPWSLRECCWGCWRRTQARQLHWGHKGRGMDGDGEGWTNKVEEGPPVKTV